KHPPSSPETVETFGKTSGDEVRLIVHTQPQLITGTGSKNPNLFEVRVSGEKFEERRAFALQQLGQEVPADRLTKEGEFLDVIGVTKGFGFQGHIQRWGVKLQPRKNSKHRRMIGTLGPHNPASKATTAAPSSTCGSSRSSVTRARTPSRPPVGSRTMERSRARASSSTARFLGPRSVF